MDKKRRLSRLGTKLVSVSVLGLALAFAVFYLVDSIALPWLLYSERFALFWQARSEAAIREYQDYITENGLTIHQVLESQARPLTGFSTEVSTIAASSSFAVSVPDVEDIVSYGFVWNPVDAAAPLHETGSFDFIVELHQIQCADGVLFISAPSSAVQAQGIGRIAGLLLALLVFCAVTVPCIVRLVRRIGLLSRETGVLMAGDLDHSIHMTGRDELSGLGDDIERLRQSVAARLEGEREAVRANSRLITTLSHDLRTPLTKLTGYLDILSYQKYHTPEEHDEFLRLASEKAAQLKALSDQLFASARVDAPVSGLEQPPEAVDGAALLGQLLAEQCDDLRREGFDVRPPVLETRFSLYLQTSDAVRIFDNLFSNLKKYADPAFPVAIHAEDGPETVTLRLTNHALPAPDRADSHGLGVPAMTELMSRSGGRLEASLSNGIYTSVLIFQKHRGVR